MSTPTTPAQPIAPQTEVPQGFIDYVQANYNGVIDIHAPEWHAKRLWAAAMHQVKVAQPIAVSAPSDSIQQLMKFYSAATLEELIETQAKHVERLQSKLPSDQQPSFTRVREG